MLTSSPAAKRVLICNDEWHIVRLLQANLERQGWPVKSVGCGKEAITCRQREPFELAVIDTDLPDLTGYTVLNWIRTREETRRMRVVLMDPGANELRDDPALEHRADLYVERPYDPQSWR